MPIPSEYAKRTTDEPEGLGADELELDRFEGAKRLPSVLSQTRPVEFLRLKLNISMAIVRSVSEFLFGWCILSSRLKWSRLEAADKYVYQ